ncbi:hypothetical protein [Enterovibrio norvegicus]|uniref:hypothetical protein n=1 Tax=Enterovibrio norvegicus TaxID=188144 RepID=UPI00352CA663
MLDDSNTGYIPPWRDDCVKLFTTIDAQADALSVMLRRYPPDTFALWRVTLSPPESPNNSTAFELTSEETCLGVSAYAFHVAAHDFPSCDAAMTAVGEHAIPFRWAQGEYQFAPRMLGWLHWKRRPDQLVDYVTNLNQKKLELKAELTANLRMLTEHQRKVFLSRDPVFGPISMRSLYRPIPVANPAVYRTSFGWCYSQKKVAVIRHSDARKHILQSLSEAGAVAMDMALAKFEQRTAHGMNGRELVLMSNVPPHPTQVLVSSKDTPDKRGERTLRIPTKAHSPLFVFDRPDFIGREPPLFNNSKELNRQKNEHYTPIVPECGLYSKPIRNE